MQIMIIILSSLRSTIIIRSIMVFTFLVFLIFVSFYHFKLCFFWIILHVYRRHKCDVYITESHRTWPVLPNIARRRKGYFINKQKPNLFMPFMNLLSKPCHQKSVNNILRRKYQYMKLRCPYMGQFSMELIHKDCASTFRPNGHLESIHL